MNSNEIVKETVENSFQENDAFKAELIKYITQTEVYFGICEESEDLSYLQQSYDF